MERGKVERGGLRRSGERVRREEDWEGVGKVR